jgi:hypothetical protein
MKLQGASVLDLVTELLVRLDAQHELTLNVGQHLAEVLRASGYQPVEVFERVRLGRMQQILVADTTKPSIKELVKKERH